MFIEQGISLEKCRLEFILIIVFRFRINSNLQANHSLFYQIVTILLLQDFQMDLPVVAAK